MRLDAMALAAVLAGATLTGAQAQEKTVMVGGAAMYPSKDIVDNAVNSKDHTTPRSQNFPPARSRCC